MISEKWITKFDIQKLQKQLYNEVLAKEITRQSAAFGGWSVLSGNGDYQDGWQRGHILLNPSASQEDKRRIKDSIPKKFSEYTVETEICSGYLKEVIDYVRQAQLQPYRARIICLTAGLASTWHRDTPSKHYAVRLHIPIVTNPECFFETKTEKEHFPADGSAYFVYVNREHRVYNAGASDRYHLVIDVNDETNVSKYHRKKEFVPKED